MKKKNIILFVIVLLTMTWMNGSSTAITVDNKTGHDIKIHVINGSNTYETFDYDVKPNGKEKLPIPQDVIKSITKDRPLSITAKWYSRATGSRSCTYMAQSDNERVSVRIEEETSRLQCIPE